MHQHTCAMSNMPEHNRDCTPVCVELPLFRQHAAHAGKSIVTEDTQVCCTKDYAAKEQENGLTMDLTRLKDSAACVINTLLSWSNILEITCSLLSGFLSANFVVMRG